MASRDSSTGSSFSSNVVRQETFRAYKSRDHQGERIERTGSNGNISVTYNHRARGYDNYAPSPRYSDASSYKKKQ